MQQDPPTITHTADSQLRRPGQLLSTMARDLRASRALGWRLAVRDIRARYRASLLGILWAFIPPVITTIVFVVLNSKGAIRIERTPIPYPLFVLAGTILWGLFSESVRAPLKALNAAKSMLSKLNFPREALLLQAMLTTLFNFGIKILLLGVLYAWYFEQIAWSAWMPVGLLLAVTLLVQGMVFGMLLVPLGMLYSDVQNSMTHLITLWFFVTPVIYPPPSGGGWAMLVRANPVTPLLQTARDLLTGQAPTQWTALAISLSVTLVLAMLLWVVYRVSLPILIERAGA